MGITDNSLTHSHFHHRISGILGCELVPNGVSGECEKDCVNGLS